MSFELPRIYAIVDADFAPDPLGRARALIAGGIRIVQMRAKNKTAREAYELALALRELTHEADVLFAVNDRPDLAAAVEADILHLGQDDLPPAAARKLFDGIIGLSTHTLEHIAAANEQPIQYIGFGPVFGTTTKENPDPVTGIDGLAAAVRASNVPVVAIGGITLNNIADVWQAGATSAALISALGKTTLETEHNVLQWLAKERL